MRIERRSGADERRVVIGCVTDPVVLGRITAAWPTGPHATGLFGSPWADMVAGWCVAYYGRYGAAPGKAIAGQFARWADKNPDKKDVISLVENFLHSLSQEAEVTDYSSEYIIDLAGEHFTRTRLRQLAEGLEADLGAGDLPAATKKVAEWGRVELGGGAGIDVLHDTAALQQCFTERQASLISYPGAVGEFFGDALHRGAFIAFQAPEKRGKTWWLLDMAWRGACQRKRVAFFEVGDMTESQIMLRWACRAARHPAKARTVYYPTAITRGETDLSATPTHDARVFTTPLNYQLAVAGMQETITRHVKSNDTYLRLVTHPNDSINVTGLKSTLQQWEGDGWVPDVIIIDYADILAPPIGAGQETRDQINKTWKQLRALSQTQHALVVTATQADADSYGRAMQSRQNFSEDKRKYGHVDGMIAINQTNEEKKLGVQRLAWLVLRGEEFMEYNQTHVAGCLALGNPAIRSCK